MALINCKRCGKEISDKSVKCVHCGCDTERYIPHCCPECGQEYNNILCKNCGYRNNDTKVKVKGNKLFPFVISFVFGFATFIFVLLEMDNFLGAFIFACIAFYVSLLIFGGVNVGSIDDFDDYLARNDSDPYKRALYKQVKKSNKK